MALNAQYVDQLDLGRRETGGLSALIVIKKQLLPMEPYFINQQNHYWSGFMPFGG
jgi:hypothetical protein